MESKGNDGGGSGAGAGAAAGSVPNALVTFVTLAKSATGKAAHALIEKALSQKGLFTFGELMEMPNIKALQGTPQGDSHWRLLELFAHGTYPDYLKAAGSVPELSAAQERKLRQLTVVTLASTRKTLPYAHLLRELGLDGMPQTDGVRALEDLVIECFYAGLLKGKLDQRRQQLSVHHAVGRDIRPNELDEMLEKLAQWDSLSSDILQAVEQRLADASGAFADSRNRREAVRQRIERVKLEMKSQMEARISPSCCDITFALFVISFFL